MREMNAKPRIYVYCTLRKNKYMVCVDLTEVCGDMSIITCDSDDSTKLRLY